MSPAATTYIVITQQISTVDGDWCTNYYWDGRHHATHQDAIDAGGRRFGHDDFNVGRIKAGRLIWFGWMNKELPDYDLAEISKHLGLEARRG